MSQYVKATESQISSTASGKGAINSATSVVAKEAASKEDKVDQIFAWPIHSYNYHYLRAKSWVAPCDLIVFGFTACLSGMIRRGATLTVHCETTKMAAEYGVVKNAQNAIVVGAQVTVHSDKSLYCNKGDVVRLASYGYDFKDDDAVSVCLRFL